MNVRKLRFPLLNHGCPHADALQESSHALIGLDMTASLLYCKGISQVPYMERLRSSDLDSRIGLRSALPLPSWAISEPDRARTGAEPAHCHSGTRLHLRIPGTRCGVSAPRVGLSLIEKKRGPHIQPPKTKNEDDFLLDFRRSCTGVQWPRGRSWRRLQQVRSARTWLLRRHFQRRRM